MSSYFYSLEGLIKDWDDWEDYKQCYWGYMLAITEPLANEENQ